MPPQETDDGLTYRKYVYENRKTKYCQTLKLKIKVNTPRRKPRIFFSLRTIWRNIWINSCTKN